MSKSQKGSRFERDICRLLSEWVSGGKRDDLFWRTSMSGGRATIRSRGGKETHGQYGDITATHPKGRKLTKLVTIELKCGYTKASLMNLIDHEKNEGSIWWGFLEQASTAAKKAGTPYWWLIVKQNYCIPMLYMPTAMADRLAVTYVRPKVSLVVPGYRVTGFQLHKFLAKSDPKFLIIE